MLLIVEKGIRGGIFHVVHRYIKANNKCMKDYDKNKNHHIFWIQMQITHMDGQCVKICLQVVLNG